MYKKIIPILLLLLLVPTAIIQITAQVNDNNWQHPAFDRTNTGFSPQTQINKDNINDLELRWIFQVPGYWGSGGGVPGEVIVIEGDQHAGHDHGGDGDFNFEVPHVPTGVQTVPLVVNGIVYIASEYNVLYALNADNSQLLWRFAAPIGSFDEKNWWARVYAQHGIDYFDDKVWMQASDCTIYGLDPMTGEVLVTIPDTCKDIPGNTGIYWASFAPIEYNNLLITRPTGGGGFTGERGFISAYDKDTGELVWRWETIPPTGNEEDWAADLVSKGNLDNYPWDWGKCEKVAEEEHEEEHGDEHSEELLAIMAEIETNVHEFEEKAMDMGIANDELMELIEEIEDHVGDITHEIEHPHGNDLTEIMHEVEEHVHELEEMLSPISSTDELLAILTDIESGIEEFEEHEAEEHGEGHEGHDEHKEGLHDCNWIGGGSVWTLIALDEDTGDIFFTTNAPTPDVPGDMRPGPNLFTSSVVSLNANTGEMNWYYQIVTHDIYYHESRWSTILAEIESGDSTQKAVIVGSKTNLVHVLDAATGKPIYESIRVGPPAINTQQADMGNNADMELSQADLVRQQVCPGFQGGIDAAPAFAHNTIYVVTQTFCTSYIEEEGAPYKDGEADIFHHVAGPMYFDSFHVGNASLYAIDASNGRVKWVYEMENRNQYGAVTTSGGIVFVPDRLGKIHAVDEETGELLRIFTTGGLGGAGVSIGSNAYGQATLFITSGGAGEFGQRTTGILQAYTLADGSEENTQTSQTNPNILSIVSLGIAVIAIAFSMYVVRKNRSN
mgnify:CR=1 FL=1